MTAHATCDGCGAASGALMKYSLGKDFFGRVYDRLSPSTDQSPKWYCESCSMLKNLQRDFRDIRAEFDKLSKGQPSALAQADDRQRAQLRLREIATLAAVSSPASTLISAAEASQLLASLQQQGAPA
ncbi:MAG: hypothetical protein U0172_05935 [Nitrospiraceae bacterium]